MISKKIIAILAIVVFYFTSYSQNVGIGTNTPHISAALEVKDSERGILIPRMTMAQRTAIQNPAEGLIVYQTDSTKGFWYWDGNTWNTVTNIRYIQSAEEDIRRLQTQLYLKIE